MCFLSLILSFAVRPFASPKLNKLMLSALSIQTLTLAYGLLLIVKSNAGVSTATSRCDAVCCNVSHCIALCCCVLLRIIQFKAGVSLLCQVILQCSAASCSVRVDISHQEWAGASCRHAGVGRWHTATHNGKHHAATHCNTLQHEWTGTRCRHWNGSSFF